MISKGENSSVMTVALSEAIEQKEEYSGIVLIEGSNFIDWKLLNTVLNRFSSERKIIGFSASFKPLLAKIGIDISPFDKETTYQDNLVYLADLSQIENFIQIFHQNIS